MEYFLPTGNEFISLPKINESTSAIEDLTFLSMQHKGLIDIRGNTSLPLFAPLLSIKTIDGSAIEFDMSSTIWKREHYWIPCMHASSGQLSFDMTVLAPVGERGFAVSLTVTAKNSLCVSFGLHGCFSSVWQCINEDKPLDGTVYCYNSNWNESFVIDYRNGASVFSLAPMTDSDCHSSYKQTGNEVSYKLVKDASLLAGESSKLTIFWGLGYEEVAAVTSAKEMKRRTYDWEYKRTAGWLSARSSVYNSSMLTELYNTNLFFCMFYSTGITLDTEELVCVTSRSTRYYVSAAYWDRDTLLWSFPAILDADIKLAASMLNYIFTRQRRNIGTHSRYIDGTVLEPGFELDELMAPIIALAEYVRKTGDKSYSSDNDIHRVIASILEKLDDAFLPELGLYETFLQPTDDEIVHPYITYDNMLVWRVYNDLAFLYPDAAHEYTDKAASIKAAILRNCIRTDSYGKSFFAWSVDANGHYDIYDEPPGSLELMPYYGFCSYDDETWKNTVSIIRSPQYKYSFADAAFPEIGCPHAPYPWVLSLCNSLLCGYAKTALSELETIVMDNRIACESIDPQSGVCMTGAAFATCAGFLCHSIKYACENSVTERNEVKHEK